MAGEMGVGGLSLDSSDFNKTETSGRRLKGPESAPATSAGKPKTLGSPHKPPSADPSQWTEESAAMGVT